MSPSCSKHWRSDQWLHHVASTPKTQTDDSWSKPEQRNRHTLLRFLKQHLLNSHANASCTKSCCEHGHKWHFVCESLLKFSSLRFMRLVVHKRTCVVFSFFLQPCLLYHFNLRACRQRSRCLSYTVSCKHALCPHWARRQPHKSAYSRSCKYSNTTFGFISPLLKRKKFRQKPWCVHAKWIVGQILALKDKIRALPA